MQGQCSCKRQSDIVQFSKANLHFVPVEQYDPYKLQCIWTEITVLQRVGPESQHRLQFRPYHSKKQNDNK